MTAGAKAKTQVAAMAVIIQTRRSQKVPVDGQGRAGIVCRRRDIQELRLKDRKQ